MVKRASSRTGRKSAARKAGEAVTDKATGTATYTVFISHSSKEAWIARQISKEIEALGAETWLDLKQLRGGDEIRRSIRRGIRASQEAAVLLSANSLTSEWVGYEVGVADGQGKRITPILNNISREEALAPLRDIKAIDLNDLDDFLVELAERIKNRRGRSRKVAS